MRHTSNRWMTRLEQLRQATLTWLDKERRPQAFLARKIRYDKARISTFLSGTWDPSERRSLEFVEALEQVIYRDERDWRVVPRTGEHDHLPDNLSPDEERRRLEDQCVRNDLERRNQLLDNFEAPTALLLVDELFFRALDSRRCSGRLCLNVVGFYMSAFMRLYENRLCHDVSEGTLFRQLRWLDEVEEVARNRFPQEAKEPCALDRLRNSAGVARIAAGLTLLDRGAPATRCDAVIQKGCEDLVLSLGLDPSLPRDARLGMFEADEEPVFIKIVLAGNALHVFDLLLDSGYDKAKSQASALGEVLGHWNQDELVEVFELNTADSLLASWKETAPELAQSIADVREGK